MGGLRGGMWGSASCPCPGLAPQPQFCTPSALPAPSPRGIPVEGPSVPPKSRGGSAGGGGGGYPRGASKLPAPRSYFLPRGHFRVRHFLPEAPIRGPALPSGQEPSPRRMRTAERGGAGSRPPPPQSAPLPSPSRPMRSRGAGPEAEGRGPLAAGEALRGRPRRRDAAMGAGLVGGVEGPSRSLRFGTIAGTFFRRKIEVGTT